MRKKKLKLPKQVKTINQVLDLDSMSKMLEFIDNNEILFDKAVFISLDIDHRLEVRATGMNNEFEALGMVEAAKIMIAAGEMGEIEEEGIDE